MEDLNQEQLKSKESLDMSQSVVGFRVFRIGEFDENSLTTFKKQIQSIKDFSEYLEQKFEKPPQIRVITNADLLPEGVDILESSGLSVIKVQSEKANRRANLAKNFIGEESHSTGEFSYVDMLNSLGENVDGAKDYIFVSSDLANDPVLLSEQIKAMKVILDEYKGEKDLEKVAMVGGMVSRVHDFALVQKIMEGEVAIDLDNLHKVFPNNACAIVPSGADFSGITDNGLVGTVEVGGKPELVGGNEDFLYAFEEMIYSNKNSFLLIGSGNLVQNNSSNEVMGISSKYARRQKVYRLYAERAVRQGIKRGKIDWKGDLAKLSENLPAIVEDIIDKHLFFVQMDENKKPKIILTNRQKSKHISLAV